MLSVITFLSGDGMMIFRHWTFFLPFIQAEVKDFILYLPLESGLAFKFDFIYIELNYYFYFGLCGYTNMNDFHLCWLTIHFLYSPLQSTFSNLFELECTSMGGYYHRLSFSEVKDFHQFVYKLLPFYYSSTMIWWISMQLEYPFFNRGD